MTRMAVSDYSYLRAKGISVYRAAIIAYRRMKLYQEVEKAREERARKFGGGTKG